MHQDESNMSQHEYILSWIYILKIKFNFLSYKVKKFKVDKPKGTEGVQLFPLSAIDKSKKFFNNFIKLSNSNKIKTCEW